MAGHRQSLYVTAVLQSPVGLLHVLLSPVRFPRWQPLRQDVRAGARADGAGGARGRRAMRQRRRAAARVFSVHHQHGRRRPSRRKHRPRGTRASRCLAPVEAGSAPALGSCQFPARPCPALGADGFPRLRDIDSAPGDWPEHWMTKPESCARDTTRWL